MTLENRYKSIIHRNLYCGVELKYIKLPESKIKIKEGREEVTISSDKLTLFARIESPGKIFEDNGFILLPGEKMSVKYRVTDSKKKSNNPISVVSLNQYLQ